jgi:hypothetical protein
MVGPRPAELVRPDAPLDADGTAETIFIAEPAQMKP